MLESIDTTNVLMLLEDFFLTHLVDEAGIQEAVSLMLSGKVDAVQLRGVDCSEPSGSTENRRLMFSPVVAGSPWQISTQAAIWRKDTLCALLEPGWSPWDFEVTGTRVAAGLPLRILRPNRSVLYYRHAVERGKWLPQGIANCASAGLTIDYARRPALSPEELRKLVGRKHSMRSRLARMIPPRILSLLRRKPDEERAIEAIRERTIRRLQAAGALRGSDETTGAAAAG
jgi:hypothetical protein